MVRAKKNKSGVIWENIVKTLKDVYDINDITKISIVIDNYPTNIESQINTYINKQKSYPFNNDRYDDAVFSNQILSIFEEGEYNYTLSFLEKVLIPNVNYNSKKIAELNNLIKNALSSKHTEYMTDFFFDPTQIVKENIDDNLRDYLFNTMYESNFVHNFNNHNPELENQLLNKLF